MHDVFFFEAFDEEAEALKSLLPAAIDAGFSSATIQESQCGEPPAALISIRTQSDIPPGWAESLQAILSRSTGYDHLAAYRVETGTRAALGYLPLYCARAVAEQAMLLWMALLRKLPLQTRLFENFHRDGLTGAECEGKNLLVVGVGNIGRDIVRIGGGLGMSVSCVDIVERHPGLNYVTLAAGLPSADVVVCAMNLTDRNRGYFSYDTLAQCKPGAVFINVARGEFVSSVDLLRLLDEEKLGGVGLDVYRDENILAGGLRSGLSTTSDESRAVMEMFRRSDVVLTPHNAFNTAESVWRKAEQSIEQIEAFRASGSFKWPVP